MIIFNIGGNNTQLQKVLLQTQELALKSVRATAVRITAISASVAAAAGALAVGALRMAGRQIENLFAGIKSAFDLAGTLSDLHAQTSIAIDDLYLLRQAFQENSLDAGKVGGAVNRLQHPPFPRRPVRPNGCFSDRPPKANS